MLNVRLIVKQTEGLCVIVHSEELIAASDLPESMGKAELAVFPESILFSVFQEYQPKRSLNDLL